MVNSAPEISIVIPCYDASDNVVRCIESILDQRGVDSYEVIVVDSSPTTDVAAACEQFDDRVKLIKLETRAYPGKARNIGLERVQGAIIVFADTKMICPQNWLQKIAKKFRSPHIDAIAGTRKPAPGSTLAGRSQFYAEFFDFSVMDNPKRCHFVPGGNVAFRRDLLGDKPFDGTMRRSEDTLFFVSTWGRPIVIYPELVCDYTCVRTWREAIRHLFGLGWWSGYLRFHHRIIGRLLARSVVATWMLWPYRMVRFAKFVSRNRRLPDIHRVWWSSPLLLAVWTMGFFVASLRESLGGRKAVPNES